ncbi:MAG: hypothetical protein ACP5SP_08120, partial [Caldisericum sp.]|uniref:hypothetical protein n=1 Tax=Caldisericum sp. TaxID=2499687 RepID=UPI003D12F50A
DFPKKAEPEEQKTVPAIDERQPPKLTKMQKKVLEDIKSKPKEKWTEFERRVFDGIKRKEADNGNRAGNSNDDLPENNEKLTPFQRSVLKLVSDKVAKQNEKLEKK